MSEELKELEMQMAQFRETERIYRLREVSLMQRTQEVILTLSELSDKIADLDRTIDQMKASESPKGWFIRNFSR